MKINTFMLVMGALVIINDLVVQAIKIKITNENTTLVAFITAIILAYLGLYFKFYEFDLVATGVLGLAVGLFGTNGYDKVKECYSSIVLLMSNK
jgi:hypothetical protein